MEKIKQIELYNYLTPTREKKIKLLSILFDNPLYFYFKGKKKKRLMKLYKKLKEKEIRLEKLIFRYDYLSKYHDRLFNQYK